MRVSRLLGSGTPADDDMKAWTVELRQVWHKVLSELLRNFNGLQASGTFNASNLVAGVLAYQHNLGSRIVEVTIIDPTGFIRGDLAASGCIVISDENTIGVDLSLEAVDENDWSIMVRRD